eukprot:COSAG05_NODE_260_length_12737_cov_4.788891_6_plen_87_part_00
MHDSDLPTFLIISLPIIFKRIVRVNISCDVWLVSKVRVVSEQNSTHTHIQEEARGRQWLTAVLIDKREDVLDLHWCKGNPCEYTHA